MAEPEVNVEIVVPETTVEDDKSGAPEIVVVETAAPSGGTDPAAVLSMEMLLQQVTEARSEINSLKSEVAFLRDWQSSQSSRISDLETVEEVEEVIDSGEIVAEVIPAAVVETPVEESKPRERKRKFI